MDFNKMLQDDLDSIFFNTAEFGEPHEFQGEKVTAIVESSRMQDFSGKRFKKLNNLYTDGIYTAEKVVQIRKKDLSFKPFKDQLVTFDKKDYEISFLEEENGCYVIGLEAKETE